MFFLHEQPLYKNSLSVYSHTNSCLIDVNLCADLPASFTFFLRWIELKQSLEGGGGWGKGPDLAFLLLFHENPASRYFFHRFSEFLLLFPETTTTTTEKKNRASVWFAFAAAQAYDFPIPNIQGKNPPSRLNFQNVFWSLQKDPFNGKWSPAKSYFKQNYFHAWHTRFAIVLLRKFTNYAFFRIPHRILVNYTLNNYNK